MPLHGLFAQDKLSGNGRVRLTLRNKAKDFEFAFGETHLTSSYDTPCNLESCLMQCRCCRVVATSLLPQRNTAASAVKAPFHDWRLLSQMSKSGHLECHGCQEERECHDHRPDTNNME